jgi:signal transduction histidine kinase
MSDGHTGTPFGPAVDALGDGVVAVSRDDSRIRHANAAFRRLTGYDPATDAGGRYTDLARRLVEAAETGETFVHDTAMADGDRLTVEVYPSGTDLGGERLALGVVRDATGRLEREAELQRQNERLEEFAAVVRHDLRNPINVLQDRLPLYREDGEEGHLDAAESSRPDGRHRHRPADARPTGGAGGHVAPASLATAAEAAWDVVDTGDAELGVAGDVVIEADAGRLGALLENLFSNTVEHGFEREEFEATSPLMVTVGPTNEGFLIADDGVGVPEAGRESAFERGVSTTTDGTGLGLSIVQAVAIAHGWSVDLSASVTDGARFDFLEVE